LVRQDEGRLLTSTGVILYAPLHCCSSTQFSQTTPTISQFTETNMNKNIIKRFAYGHV